MRSFRTTTLTATLLAVGTAGCSDFLSGPDVTGNPNQPTAATRDALFVAFQAGQFGVQEYGLAQLACEWMQQCAGTQRFSFTRATYDILDSDFNADWAQIYGAGGLKEIREVEASATTDNEIVYRGIAKVWEAFTMGTAASIWGDIPYSQAGPDNPTPVFDDQLVVYDALQVLLDGAIADLQSGIVQTGVGANDFVYVGNAAQWVEAAHTLKARFFLHTAEVRGAPAYTSAQAEATLGISTPLNNFTSRHSQTQGEQNGWWQFYNLSGFGTDVVAGQFLADLMVARNDSLRLAEYFAPTNPTASPPAAPTYGGLAPDAVGQSAAGVSQLQGTRATPEFRQPYISWQENQMILAEANFVLSGAAAAQPFVDAIRASAGLLPVPVTSLNTIMEEKYVALFQNIEVFNDYKRTCYPTITPFPNPSFSGVVPGRIFYAQSETNVNPNAPSVAQQLATNGFRNDNDPAPCP
jgi:starch-binding outer membrane protein, SusD/RagB family